MGLQGFYTAKGLALAAKISAGSKLTVTKVTAGSGTSDASASVLANTKQTLTVGAAEVVGQTATLPVTLAEVNATASYMLKELGVYATDPDEGEILFLVFELSEERAITAGGESVYRFYLRQTVGADGVSVTCSPAGLLTEEDLLPLRNRVLVKSLPSRAVTVAAEDLAAYVASLPRLLAEELTVTVSSGTTSSRLDIVGFVGPGKLWIQAAKGATVALTGGLYIRETPMTVILYGLSFSGISYLDSVAYIYAGRNVYMNKCSFTGGTAYYGLQTTVGSGATLNACTISGCSVGATSERGTFLSLNDCSGSRNTNGVAAYYGGIVGMSGTTPTLMGGSSNINNGLIYKHGTLL